MPRSHKRGTRLYRLFDKPEHAKAMMQGSLRFGTLALYRDFEEQEVRGDCKEGTNIYAPAGGPKIDKNNSGKFSTLEGFRMESNVKAGEIMALCLSKSLDDGMKRAFSAVACVEILDVPKFCRRVEAVLQGATLGGKPGCERIGFAVQYYNPEHPPGAAYAVPEMIATSKMLSYRWQDEFRMLYSRTDALKFQNVSMKLVKGEPEKVVDTSQHHEILEVGSLGDIALLPDFRVE